jgi:hypothetical protein
VVSDSSTSKFYLDGFFRGESDRATGDKIKTIGNTNNGGQRFAEYLDEFRVYGIALTDFEVEKIYREAGGSLLAVGEGNYSVSVWVKPDSLLATPVYDFAFGWYEGGGGEYMQARMSQGDITDYNQLDYFNPGDTLQKTVLEGFVTERLFNGSFNDVQLDDIDYGHIAQSATLDISTYPNIVLWLDASDTSTIVPGTGNEIETWTDKIDSTIKLISHTTNKPDTNSSINGLNAIDFDKRSQNNTEYMFAQKMESIGVRQMQMVHLEESWRILFYIWLEELILSEERTFLLDSDGEIISLGIILGFFGGMRVQGPLLSWEETEQLLFLQWFIRKRLVSKLPI